MKKEDIKNAIQDPCLLEELYRQNPNEFVDIFPLVYEENKESIVLNVWKERLFYVASQRKKKEKQNKQLVVTILLAVVTGFVVRIPQFIPAVEGDWFYPRYPVILSLTAVSIYFLFKYSFSKHLLAFILVSNSIFFVFIGLFSLIDVKIENWYMENIVVMGLVAAPIVATYIIDSVIGVRTKIASILAKIFMPLFLITVVVYLAAMVFEQKSPYSDRDFLIVFNALLLLVLAISVFSIIEKKFQESSKIIEITNILLVLTTLVIDTVALSAILFRLKEYGITPNRIAVLGANILIFIHLCGFVKPYIEIFRKKRDYNALEKWTAKYLPIYSLWSLIVALGFPVLFGFK